MDLLGELERQGVAVFNPPRAIEAAVDKYLASARLLAAGLRVPRTNVCQTPDEALSAFHQLGGDVVLKPLFGGEGRGIARLNDEALAERAFRMLARLGSVLYLQEFLPHRGFDIRVLVIGRRTLPIRRATRTTGERTSAAARRPSRWNCRPVDRPCPPAAQAIGAPLAGVDLLPLDEGPPYVLEVNAVPGWKALAAALQIDVAAEVLRFVEEELA